MKARQNNQELQDLGRSSHVSDGGVSGVEWRGGSHTGNIWPEAQTDVSVGLHEVMYINFSPRGKTDKSASRLFAAACVGRYTILSR